MREIITMFILASITIGAIIGAGMLISHIDNEAHEHRTKLCNEIGGVVWPNGWSYECIIKEAK